MGESAAITGSVEARHNIIKHPRTGSPYSGRSALRRTGARGRVEEVEVRFKRDGVRLIY